MRGDDLLSLIDCLIPLFDKLLDEELTRTKLLLVNDLDISLDLEEIDTGSEPDFSKFKVPYVYGLRCKLLLLDDKKPYFDTHLNSYFFTDKYLVYDLELDIDIGYLYNYSQYSFNFNIVSNYYEVNKYVLKESISDIDWTLSLDELKKKLNFMLDHKNYMNNLTIDKLDLTNIKSNLENYSLCLPYLLNASSDYRCLRSIHSYNFLYNAHYQHDYCLYQRFEIYDSSWMLGYYKNIFEYLESVLKNESENLSESIISTYCFDLYIDDNFDSFKYFYKNLYNLFSKYKLKSNVYILISQWGYYKYKVMRYINNNKLKNFIIINE